MMDDQWMEQKYGFIKEFHAYIYFWGGIFGFALGIRAFYFILFQNVKKE